MTSDIHCGIFVTFKAPKKIESLKPERVPIIENVRDVNVVKETAKRYFWDTLKQNEFVAKIDREVVDRLALTEEFGVEEIIHDVVQLWEKATASVLRRKKVYSN